jgi:hypothetical protein
MRISIEAIPGVSWYIQTGLSLMDNAEVTTRTVILVRRYADRRYFRRMAHTHFHVLYGVFVVVSEPVGRAGPVFFCDTRDAAEVKMRRVAIAVYRESLFLQSSWLGWKCMTDSEDKLELMK